MLPRKASPGQSWIGANLFNKTKVCQFSLPICKGERTLEGKTCNPMSKLLFSFVVLERRGNSGGQWHIVSSLTCLSWVSFPNMLAFTRFHKGSPCGLVSPPTPNRQLPKKYLHGGVEEGWHVSRVLSGSNFSIIIRKNKGKWRAEDAKHFHFLCLLLLTVAGKCHFTKKTSLGFKTRQKLFFLLDRKKKCWACSIWKNPQKGETLFSGKQKRRIHKP